MMDICIQEEGSGGGTNGGSFTDIVQQKWYRSFVRLSGSILYAGGRFLIDSFGGVAWLIRD
jgi:hypothetical protein